MSVRNIEQGYYDIPSTTIPLDFVGAFSETVNADINISGGGAINIHIPSFTSVITATATLYAAISLNMHILHQFQLYLCRFWLKKMILIHQHHQY